MGVEYALEKGFDYVLTINQDAVVDPDYLEKLLRCAATRPEAIWGSTILEENTKKVWAFGVTPKWAYSLDKTEPPLSLFTHNFWGRDLEEVKVEIQEPYAVEAINGDGTLIPTDIFRKIGLYDFRWCPQYHADSEFVMRAKRAGFEAFICSDAILLNEDVKTSSIRSAWQRISSKRSDKYWRPVLKLYWGYAPLHLKPFSFWVYLYHLKFLPGKIFRRLRG